MDENGVNVRTVGLRRKALSFRAASSHLVSEHGGSFSHLVVLEPSGNRQGPLKPTPYIAYLQLSLSCENKDHLFVAVVEVKGKGSFPGGTVKKL